MTQKIKAVEAWTVASGRLLLPNTTRYRRKDAIHDACSGYRRGNRDGRPDEEIWSILQKGGCRIIKVRIVPEE